MQAGLVFSSFWIVIDPGPHVHLSSTSRGHNLVSNWLSCCFNDGVGQPLYDMSVRVGHPRRVGFSLHPQCTRFVIMLVDNRYVESDQMYRTRQLDTSFYRHMELLRNTFHKLCSTKKMQKCVG